METKKKYYLWVNRVMSCGVANIMTKSAFYESKEITLKNHPAHSHTQVDKYSRLVSGP